MLLLICNNQLTEYFTDKKGTYHRTDKKVDSTIWKQTTTINIDTKYGDYGVGTADIEGA